LAVAVAGDVVVVVVAVAVAADAGIAAVVHWGWQSSMLLIVANWLKVPGSIWTNHSC